MKLEIGAAIAEAIDTRISPYIRAMAAIFAKLDVVDVRCIAGFEYAYELMLRAIERAHAGVSL